MNIDYRQYIGKKFNKLTVIDIIKKQYILKNGGKNGFVVYFKCKCDCGNEVIRQAKTILGNHKSSCGCQKRCELGLVGKKFGKWTVLKEIFTTNNKRYCKCVCECGNIKEVSSYSLIKGKSKSCNKCSSTIGLRSTTHGKSHSRLWIVWRGIKTRCYNKKNKDYKNYGGRGIVMCDEWKNNYSVFQEWAIKNGYDVSAKKGIYTIDRIDVNGDYCPENCRFINIKEQERNRRDTIYCIYKGLKITLKEYCEKTNQNYYYVYYHLVKMNKYNLFDIDRLLC